LQQSLSATPGIKGVSTMDKTENKEQDFNRQIGGTAGLGAGILTGMRVGSILIPIPVVGTFLGGLAGGVLGSAAGKKIVPAVMNAASSFVQTLTETPAEQKPTEAEHTVEEELLISNTWRHSSTRCCLLTTSGCWPFSALLPGERLRLLFRLRAFPRTCRFSSRASTGRGRLCY
jgi:hypothetical protein